MQVLPDVSSWDYNGTVELRGQQAHLWVYEKRWAAPLQPLLLDSFKSSHPLYLTCSFLYWLKTIFRSGTAYHSACDAPNVLLT